MLQLEKTEYNAVNELISALLELYEKDKALVTKETSSNKVIMLGQLYRLLNIKPNPKRIEYYSRILKNISSLKDSP